MCRRWVWYESTEGDEIKTKTNKADTLFYVRTAYFCAHMFLAVVIVFVTVVVVVGVKNIQLNNKFNIIGRCSHRRYNSILWYDKIKNGTPGRWISHCANHQQHQQQHHHHHHQRVNVWILFTTFIRALFKLYETRSVR